MVYTTGDDRMNTAKLFKNGRSQAVRLPKEYALSGKEVYIKDGLIYEALLASTALPGIFPPLKLNEKFLVDGGVLESLPPESVIRCNFIVN